MSHSVEWICIVLVALFWFVDATGALWWVWAFAALTAFQLVMGILALRGWRLDRLWGMLGIGFVVLSVADSIYMLQVANGTSDSSTLANVFYLTGVGLVAMSAWQPRPEAKAARLDGWSVLLVPAKVRGRGRSVWPPPG